MSAREDLIAVAIKLGVPRAWLTVWLDSYRAEVLREAAVTVRAAAPKYLDNDVDEHTFQVLNDLAAKIARGDLS